LLSAAVIIFLVLDPMGNIPPGTAFDDLPNSWSCPHCGAFKTSFEPEG
jgi:rubredoxin